MQAAQRRRQCFLRAGRHGSRRHGRRGDGCRNGPRGAGRHPADDGRVRGVRVVRMQPGDLRGAQAAGQHGPVDLVVEVGAQVPGHRLEPGHGVGRRPRLRGVARVLQGEHRVFDGEVGAAVPGQVGVHPVGVGLVVAEGDRVEQRHLPLGHGTPAEGADEGVGADLALAEQLGEPPARHVPAEVHLPEPVLGVHIALRHEQVAGAAGQDLRDAGLVAVHGHVGVEPRQRGLPGEGGEGADDRPHAQAGADQGEAERDGEHGEGGPDPAVAPAARCVGSHITPL